MTKSGVWSEYENLLEQLSDEMVAAVSDEFGGGLRGKVAQQGAKVTFKKIKKEMRVQGEIVVDYAAAIARGDGNTRQLEQDFLDTNPVYQRYDGDDKAEVKQHLLTHFRAVGEDLAPLVASDREDFWEALREEYEKDEAKALIDRNFSQAETFMRYRGDIFPGEKIANKVIPIVETGETQLKQKLYEKIDRTYAVAK